MFPRLLTTAMAGVALAYLTVLALVGLLATPQASDLAVVLGNDLRQNGQPVPRLQARLDAAVDAYRAGLVPKILVSGGVEPGDRDEAASMASYLVAQGIPRAAIIEDPHGVNTMATARDTAALWQGGRRILVVTQWFHLPRTMLAMRIAGFRTVSGAWPRFAEWRDIYSFLREAVGLPVYAVRGVFERASSSPLPPSQT